MNLTMIIDKLKKEPEVMAQKEVVVVCLNRKVEAMLEDAAIFSPAAGTVETLVCDTYTCLEDRADEAVVRKDEHGPELVTFHETRPSSRDHRPNGVKDVDIDCPCVVLWNSGDERLTVEGDWVEPGEYTALQEVNLSNEELFRILKAQGYPVDEPPKNWTRK